MSRFPTAAEVCEARLLLAVNPVVTSGQAQQNVTTAEAALALELASYESSVNGIVSGYTTALDGYQNAYSSSVGSLADAYNTNVSVVQDALTAEVASLDAAFGVTVDGLNSSLESGLTAADAVHTAATDASSAAFDAAIASLGSQLDAATATADASLEAAQTSAGQQFTAVETQATATFDTAALAADGVYETAILAHEDWLVAEEVSALAAYESATDDSATGIGGVFNASVSLAEAVRDTDLVPYSHVTYDVSAVSTINTDALWDVELAAIQPALDSAAALRDASIETAQSTYDSEIQVATDLYGSLMEAADAALDSAYDQADAAFQAAVATHHADYDQAVSGLEDVRQSALQAAADNFDLAAAAAEASYTATVEAAQGVLDDAVATAEQEFDSWQNGTLPGQTLTIWMERWRITDTSGRGPAVRWELRSGTGWASGVGSVTIQEFAQRPEPAILNQYVLSQQSVVPGLAVNLSSTETVEIERFVAPFGDPLGGLGSVTIGGLPVAELLPAPRQNPWEVQEFIQTVSYLIQLEGLELAWDAAADSAQGAYQATVSAANSTFNMAVYGSSDGQSVQPGSLAAAFQDALAAADTTFQDGEQAAFDVYETAEATFWATVDMTSTTAFDDTPLREASRDYHVDVAALNVNHAAASGSAWVSWISAERAADTTRDNAVINAEFQRGMDMAAAGAALTAGQIAAEGSWASGLIDIRADYAIASTEKQFELAGDVADAQLVFELTEHAAAETGAHAVIQATRDQQHANADANTAFTIGEVTEAADLTNDIAGEDETLQNAYAAADVVWLLAGSAAEVASTAVSAAAENTLIRDIASELTTFSNVVATEVATASQNVINAIDTAYVDWHSGDADQTAVSGIWSTFQTAVVTSVQTAIQNEASAWQAYLNEVGSDIETALNNIAAESGPQAAAYGAAAYGAALTTAVNRVAAASTTAVAQEAAAVVAWVNSTATQANAAFHSAVNAWQVKADADAAAGNIQADGHSASVNTYVRAGLTALFPHQSSLINASRHFDQAINAELTDLADSIATENFQLVVSQMTEWNNAALAISPLEDVIVVAMAMVDAARSVWEWAQQLEVTTAAPPAGFSSSGRAPTPWYSWAIDNPYVAGAGGFIQGGLQGVANSVNGVQDGIVFLANAPAFVVNGVRGAANATRLTDLPMLPYLESPDWSRGWICEEAHHELSKGLGGFGLSVWSGQAIARVAPSGLRLFGYTSGGGAVMTANGPMFTAAVTHSVTLTAGTVSGISTIIGGAGLIDNISTIMNMTAPEHGPKYTGDALDRLQEAKRQFQTNRDFRNWAHKEFMEDMKMGGGGSRNPDIPNSMIADAYEEWLQLGRPKL